jgi:hypothetical protein
MKSYQDSNIEGGNGEVIDEMNKESILSGKKVKDNDNDKDNNTQRESDGIRLHEPL